MKTVGGCPKGAVTIAASVFLFLVIVIGFSSYRYGMRVYLHLVAANLSASAGQATHRDCRFVNEELQEPCLRRVKAAVAGSNQLLSRYPVHAVISIYRKTGNGAELVTTTGPSDRYASRVSPLSFSPGMGEGYLYDMLDIHEEVCVSEIFIDFKPFAGLSMGTGTVYEVSLS